MIGANSAGPLLGLYWPASGLIMASLWQTELAQYMAQYLPITYPLSSRFCAFTVLQCCHNAAACLPLFNLNGARMKPLLCRYSASIVPECSRFFAVIQPEWCHNGATSLPLLSLYGTRMEPLLCRYSACMVPELSHFCAVIQPL